MTDHHRDEFEAHIRRTASWIDLRRYEAPHLHGAYSGEGGAEQLWQAWQESRRTYRASVLEEAAKACEGMRDLKEAKEANARANAALERGDDRDSLSRLRHHSTVGLFNGALERAAKAIRALATQTQGEQP